MSPNPIIIRNLGPEDVHVLDRVKGGVFDGPIDPSRVWGFLATRVNELVVALDRGEVVGFVSGTVIMHPDKPTQFFVKEISVHADYRRQGIARRMLAQILDLARDRGCQGVRVAAEDSNAPARSLLARLGATETGGIVLCDWEI